MTLNACCICTGRISILYPSSQPLQHTTDQPMDEDRLVYKQRHEDFVAGLSGGSIQEVCLVTLVAVSCYITWTAFRPLTKRSPVVDWFFQFVILWLPIVFSVTVYGSSPGLLNALIAAPGCLSLLRAKSKTKSKPSKDHDHHHHHSLPKQSFLTNYRAGMMILTCIAILAVDFPIFPRRFAKVETWGTSLMDLGVGSFVFSMGLVSVRPLLKHGPSFQSSRFKRLLLALKQSGTVLGLGVIRLAAVKYFDYQEHVTEYGVHWNFFITLGLLPPLVAVIDFIPRNKVPTIAVALAIAAVYELALDKTSLGAYILVAERKNIISQNKEGIFSFVGYLSIFLAGQATGYYTLRSDINWRNFLFPRSHKKTGKKAPSAWASTPIMLLVSSAVFTLLYIFSTSRLTVSRRLANLPYVLWVISYNCGFLALYSIAESIIYGKHAGYSERVPSSHEAVNKNGLFFFLVANIATGLVNMNVRTLDASPWHAIAILAGYLLSLYTVSTAMLKLGITIRL